MTRFSADRAKWSSSPRRARLVVLCVASAAILAATSFHAAAQDPYPSRPVKVLIPYAPGGATDIVARYLASEVNKVLGQPFVIENRPGASGNIALEAAARAAPDGYTLFVGNVTTNAINENTFAEQLKIKPSRDLTGITELAEIPHIVAAAPNFPANSIAEVIALARQSPGKLNYGSAGLGSYPQLDMMRFEKAANIRMTHVPYKNGAAGILPALMTGEIQLSFINLSSTIEHIKAGKIKAIATTAPARLAELPNLPTMAEQGFPGIGTNAWQAIFAPAATPKPIIDKLFNAIVSVMSTPEMKERLGRQLMAVVLSKSPQDWTDQVRDETKKWGDFIRENHIKID